MATYKFGMGMLHRGIASFSMEVEASLHYVDMGYVACESSISVFSPLINEFKQNPGRSVWFNVQHVCNFSVYQS